MRIQIRHATSYHFDAPPSHLVQRLHLTPSDFEAQKTLLWTITAPGMANSLSFTDVFGNVSHLVTDAAPEQSFTIIAEGEIETTDAAGLVRGLVSTASDQIYLRQTDRTRLSDAMSAVLSQFKTKAAALPRAHDLMQFVHSTIAYEVGASAAETTAAEAFAGGRGVCQDHAHILAGLARALKIPARYVTGYLITGTGASSTAAHAWAELLIPDLGWVGFDAANGQCPTEHYVRLAAGLDASTVAPVKGSRRGAFGAEQLTVAVHAEIAQQ